MCNEFEQSIWEETKAGAPCNLGVCTMLGCVWRQTYRLCAADGPYEPTWESLRKYKEVPDWLREILAFRRRLRKYETLLYRQECIGSGPASPT